MVLHPPGCGRVSNRRHHTTQQLNTTRRGRNTNQPHGWFVFLPLLFLCIQPLNGTLYGRCKTLLTVRIRPIRVGTHNPPPHSFLVLCAGSGWGARNEYTSTRSRRITGPCGHTTCTRVVTAQCGETSNLPRRRPSTAGYCSVPDFGSQPPPQHGVDTLTIQKQAAGVTKAVAAEPPWVRNAGQHPSRWHLLYPPAVPCTP